MKKMIGFGAALLCAAVGFADVEGANVVGYLNKATDPEEAGFNYMVCTFKPVGGGEDGISIQEMQTDASSGANIQVLGLSQATTEEYRWYKKNSSNQAGPSGKKVDVGDAKKGAWFLQPAEDDEEGEEVYAVKVFKFGESFQFSCPANKVLMFAGQVAGGVATFYANEDEAGFNYFGNPFPAEVNIQEFQTDASSGANIQVLGLSQATTEEYRWYKKNSSNQAGPSGKKVDVGADKNGAWFLQPAEDDEEGEETYATRTFAAGEGFQFSCPAGKRMTVTAPYTL